MADLVGSRPKGPRLAGWAAVGAALVVLGVVGGWALRTLLAPAPDVLRAPGYTLVRAQQATVEQSLRLNTSAQWAPASVAPNQAVGVVTTVEVKGATLARPGTVLYTVDLRPVVVAAGEVPAFRDLSYGSRGTDVAQLQRMLAAEGFYSGGADGVFSSAMKSAVRAWQRKLGVAADGVVRRGDVVFVPRLPTRLALAEKLAVGASLAGGEPVVEVLPDAPQFTIALPDQQVRLVAPGMSVEIDHSGTTWYATVARVLRRSDEGGGFVAVLAGRDGAHICGKECDSIPLGDAVLLPSVIRVVPPVTGITVPAIAVVTRADGTVGVLLADGAFRPVTVIASANGVAVVAGLVESEQVRAPGGGPAEGSPP